MAVALGADMRPGMAAGSVRDLLPCTGFRVASSDIRLLASQQRHSRCLWRCAGVSCTSAVSQQRERARTSEQTSRGGRDGFRGKSSWNPRGTDFRGRDSRDFGGRDSRDFRGRDSRDFGDRDSRDSGYSDSRDFRRDVRDFGDRDSRDFGRDSRNFGDRDSRGFRGRGSTAPRGRESFDFRRRGPSDFKGNEWPRRDYGEGRSREGQRGGYKRFGADRYRKDRRKDTNNAAYEMFDETTGEKVIVLGVDGLELPKPTQKDLQWEPAKVVASGVVSEETWYKAMEASMDGPLGAYSVRGVVQGKSYDADEGELSGEDASDASDEEEDSEYSDLEEDSDEEEEVDEVTDGGRSSMKQITRPPRVKVFGRDFGGGARAIAEVSTSHVLGDGGRQRAAPPQIAIEEDESEGTRGLKDEDEGEELDGEHEEVDIEDSDEGADGYTDSDGDDDEYDDEHGESDGYRLTRGPLVKNPAQMPKADLAAKVDLSAKASVSAARTPSSSSPRETRNVFETDTAELQSRFPDGAIVEIIDKEDEETTTSRSQTASESGISRNFFDTLRYQTYTKSGANSSTAATGKEKSSNVGLGTEPSGESADSVDRLSGKIAQRSLNMQSRSNYDAALSDSFFSPKTFKSIGASEEVIQSLQALNVQRPSEIQAIAYKRVLDGESCIIADQTGSGKTLAYLAPLVQYIREKERTNGRAGAKKPRVVVLVPTNELANQVLNVCRTISRSGLHFRSTLITGGFKWKPQVESLEQGSEIVIATPGRFLQHLQEGNIQLEELRSLVVDEADVLYDDEEFSAALQTIKKSVSGPTQYIHVTATLPVDVHDKLTNLYPDCASLMGPSLHRTAIGLQEILVDCSEADGNEKTPETAFLAKKIALLQLVQQRPVPKTIVFCNKIETCRKVENVLSRYDRNGEKLLVLPYHAALTQDARAKSLEQFLQLNPEKPTVLVCTDRASRGLDSIDVEHVVLFDYPRDPSEYVRRVGRTARGAGGTGKAYVFVVGKQVSLARRIMTRNEKGHPIHSVPNPMY